MGLYVKKYGDTRYFIRGSDPKLLVLAGSHGDEWQIIDCVTDYINSHEAILPDFLFIPRVSPSAVAQKTRKNKYGRDINRCFNDRTEDQETKATMEIVKNFSFDLCIEFHEDPARSRSVYIYDSHALPDTELALFQKAILKTGARLYTGVDDPFDAHLGFVVVKGYVSTPVDIMPPQSGFSMVWLLKSNVAKRVVNPEIPGRAPITLKQALVDAIFSFFSSHLLPL